jgi:D-alanyl-D-alanine carboxypeptidase
MAIDANTGSVLHNQAGDEPRYPASLTKMMTLYMTFELIELGRLDYSSKIKMTQEGADAAPSKLEVKPGAEITVLDAMKALVTKSANDVAIALAQHIAGTEQNFARLMTRKAHDIGMTSTTFKNASGLPDPEQTTTARDMLTLALHLRDDFPRHYELFSTRVFNYGGDSYHNHNGLLGRYRGTDGIKTGYTQLSGFNLVASVNRDGKRVVAAIFGGRTARVRDNMMEQVLNKALAKASTKVTRKPSLVARAPQPVPARPPAPAPVATAAARPPPAPPLPAVQPSQPPSAVAEATPRIAHAITMARVRHVLMGPDLKRQAAAADDEAAPPSPAFAVASAAAAAPRPQATSPRDDALPRFVPSDDILRKETSAPPLGQPPSTLQAQAEALGGPADPPAPPPITTGATVEPRAEPNPGPRPQPRAEPKPRQASREAHGAFEIQIGAFSDSAEAERNMASVRQRAGGALDSYSAVAVPAQKGASQIYRARFRGFDATAAASACGQLKKLQIDCFVVKAE